MTRVEVDWYDDEFPGINVCDEPEDYDDIYEIPNELWEQWQEKSEALRQVLAKIEKIVNDQNTKSDTPTWSWAKSAVLWGSVADHTEIKFEDG